MNAILKVRNQSHIFSEIVTFNSKNIVLAGSTDANGADAEQ
jgi:hypothetical protein